MFSVVIKYAQYNIYQLSHFQAHSSVALSTCTLLCDPHCRLQTLSFSSAETLSPLNSNSAPAPPAPGPHHLFSVSRNLTTLGASCNGNHTAFVLL